MTTKGHNRLVEEVEIPLMNGKIVKATITDTVFYDKEGIKNNE